MHPNASQMIQISPEDVDREIGNLDRRVQSLNRAAVALNALLRECQIGAPDSEVCGEIAGVFGENTAKALGTLLEVQIVENVASQDRLKSQKTQLQDILRQIKSNIVIPQAVPPRRM